MIYQSPFTSETSFYQRNKNKLWIGVLLLVIFTVGLISYLIFAGQEKKSRDDQSDVKLSIGAPQETSSGSEIAYVIKLENFSSTKLTEINIDLFYPVGFTFANSTLPPDNIHGTRYLIDELAGQEVRSFMVLGALEGSVQEIKSISAKTRYVPENFRSAFIVEASATTVMTAPDITIDVTAPSSAVSRQKISYSILIKNISDRDFSNLKLDLTYPENFEFIESSPKTQSTQNNVFDLELLRSGQELHFAISGRATQEAGTDVFMAAELLSKDSGGADIIFGRSFAITQIKKVPLLLTHTLLTDPDNVIVGAPLKYEVYYENTGDTALNNAAISLIFENDILDFAKASLERGEKKGRGIIWVPPAVQELTVVAPGQKGSFSATIPIASDLISELRKNPIAISRTEFISKEFADPLSGDRLENKVHTTAELEVDINLVAGQNNEHRVEIAIDNGVNDLRNAVLTAVIPGASSEFLPDTIFPSDEKDNVSYVPVANLLKWDLDKVLAFTGTFHEKRKLSFTIRTDQAQVIREVELIARDEFTGKEIRLQAQR